MKTMYKGYIKMMGNVVLKWLKTQGRATYTHEISLSHILKLFSTFV